MEDVTVARRPGWFSSRRRIVMALLALVLLYDGMRLSLFDICIKARKK
jgi:hypothetical protein